MNSASCGDTRSLTGSRNSGQSHISGFTSSPQPQLPDPDRIMEEDLNDYGVEAPVPSNFDNVSTQSPRQKPNSDQDVYRDEFASNNRGVADDPFAEEGKGVVEDGFFDDEDDAVPVYPMREFTFGPVSFNPVTSFIGIVMLWGMSIWCISDPASSLESLLAWRAATTEYFTWFYVGTRPLFCFFLLWLFIKYGHIKLGPPDSVPDYSNITYFAMLLSAGVEVGMFYYGVSEPLWHETSHWYAKAGYLSQDALDVFALNLTLFHWGFAGWSAYAVTAIAVALAAFRFNLPMTFRSCFYPILGEYTWGWIGDVIDGFTIVVTVFGVCTSLGLGAFEIVAGLKRLGFIDPDISESDQSGIHVLVVWGVTLLATASVVSGLNNGVKYLAIVAFWIGLLLLLLLLVLDKTSYLLNLQVQSIGYYFQHSILQINFWTDAFGQLKTGEGRAIDGKAAEDWWMDAWTVFYMAWWTSWAGFVGIFVGCISRGRTIAELIMYSVVAPLFFCIVWFGIWGGVGLRQQRQALELQKLGTDYFNDASYFLQEGSSLCFDVPQEDVILSNGTVIFHNHLPGITPVCLFDVDESEAAMFNVLYSFSYPNDFMGGFGAFLSGLVIVATTIYFITSSDSGSLVVDFLASNGNLEHHWIQRCFWAATEGAVTTALLYSGGGVAVQAVQAVSVISGLPFTLFMVYLLQSILNMCQTADEKPEDMDLDTHPSNKHDFPMPVYGGVFNVFEYIVSLGNVHEDRIACGMDLPTTYQVTEFFYGLFVPFIPLSQILWVLRPKAKHRYTNHAIVGIYGTMHLTWVVLFIMTTQANGLRAFGWAALFINGVILANIKHSFREKHNYKGNIIGDMISSTLMFPQVLCQLRIECEGIDLHLDDPSEMTSYNSAKMAVEVDGQGGVVGGGIYDEVGEAERMTERMSSTNTSNF